MTAWLFSGQVSEFPGMGGDFFAASSEARTLLEAASERCGFDLGAALESGDSIAENRVAQPGVFVVSVAAARELGRRGFEPAAIAGYSLGNYAALVSAGAISFDDALTILLAVSSFAAGRGIEGSMGAVIGLPVAAVEETCALLRSEGDPVWIGNVNAATQLVITGTSRGIDRALEAFAPKALRALRLPMTWPIHSELMDGVARDVAPVVAGCRSIAAPRVPLYAGHVGRRITTAAEVADLLTRQIALPSHWKDTVEAMFSDGHREYVEVGPGETLTRMLRWIVREGRCRPAGTLKAIDALGGSTARA